MSAIFIAIALFGGVCVGFVLGVAFINWIARRAMRRVFGW